MNFIFPSIPEIRPVVAENVKLAISDEGVRYSYEEQLLALKIPANAQQAITRAFDRNAPFLSWSKNSNSNSVLKVRDALYVKGFLSWQVGDENGALITLHASQPYYRPVVERSYQQTYPVSKFAFLSYVNGKLRIQNPLQKFALEILDNKIGQILVAQVSNGKVDGAALTETLSEGLQNEATRFVAGFLLEILREKEYERSSEFMWEFHDLVFHARSRMGLEFREVGPVATHQYEKPISPMVFGGDDKSLISPDFPSNCLILLY
jgi:hypothetical protein